MPALCPPPTAGVRQGIDPIRYEAEDRRISAPRFERKKSTNNLPALGEGLSQTLPGVKIDDNRIKGDPLHRCTGTFHIFKVLGEAGQGASILTRCHKLVMSARPVLKLGCCCANERMKLNPLSSPRCLSTSGKPLIGVGLHGDLPLPFGLEKIIMGLWNVALRELPRIISENSVVRVSRGPHPLVILVSVPVEFSLRGVILCQESPLLENVNVERCG